jgi:hypothetical protein
VRIPFPERIPINRVAIFALALFAIQRLEGTALYFSLGCAAFILIATVAFNAAGGLTRASGAYIFSYSMLVVIIGICYKAFLGEPAESHLSDPRTTIEAYVASITVMGAAVVVSRRFSRKSALLQNLLQESDMYRASVGCIVVGVAGGFVIALLGESGALLQSAFTQLNELIPLGIIIGTMCEIRRSGGTRSANLTVVFSGVWYFFFYGVIAYSKQGMLEPLLCWLLPVCALRYRLALWQVLSCVLTLFVIFHYLVPYAQYGRSFAEENVTFSQRASAAIALLEHPEKTRQAYEEASGIAGYYDEPQGFWDRLQFISTDDELINYTDQGHVFGLMPIEISFLNAIPHVFWPDKPQVNIGNVYAHEMGHLADTDESTGISFSPTAEAFHMAGWVGVLVVAPLLWCLFFIVFDSLLGDLRATPWGLLAVAMIGHTAPEGGLSIMIYLLTFGTVILTFCAIFATWVAPIFAIPVLGPDRGRRVDRIALEPAQRIP